MASPKTNREDLAKLGWPIQNIYTTLNAQRGGTMKNKDDVFVNDGISLEYQWFIYNVPFGNPYPVGNRPNTVTSTETVWSYDNTGNNQSFSQDWLEKWTESTSAELTITKRASIELNQTWNIPYVGGGSLGLSISSESTKTESKVVTHELENTWSLTVGPGEKLRIERVRTSSTGITTYRVDYGVDGLIGTKGDKFDGHYYYAFQANYYLNNPRGFSEIEGVSRSESFEHKITRTPAPGRNQPISGPGAVITKPTKVVRVENGKRIEEHPVIHE